MSIKITWDFSGTEYENFQYEEARKAAGLPETIRRSKLEEDEDIYEYLYENYGFEPSEIEDD